MNLLVAEGLGSFSVIGKRKNKSKKGRPSQTGLEGEVQDQAQKIIEMPQRDRATSASENQPSSASVVSMYGQERPSIPSLHQQLAGASGTQTIQLQGGIGAGSSAKCFSASDGL